MTQNDKEGWIVSAQSMYLPTRDYTPVTYNEGKVSQVFFFGRDENEVRVTCNHKAGDFTDLSEDPLTLYIDGDLLRIEFKNMTGEFSPLDGKAIKANAGECIPLPAKVKYGDKYFYFRQMSTQ